MHGVFKPMTKATRDHNFQKANPHLAKEWHPTKNGKLKPQDISPMSERMIWWICKAGHVAVPPIRMKSKGAAVVHIMVVSATVIRAQAGKGAVTAL
ncbi:MAG: hypothetical protein C4576_09190 [Desulfobacteraceae bacterium]|nr:MAG: hypothetical protein C4576_09190 [Desulfobacteraceae bacterium]